MNRAQTSLQRGVEVGWRGSKQQLRTQNCSRAIQSMSAARVERNGHFSGALKWAGDVGRFKAPGHVHTDSRSGGGAKTQRESSRGGTSVGR